KRGWTLIGVESGLDGLLARKIPHTVSLSDLSPASLLAALRAARADSNADAALGVAMYLEERAAELALITPKGEKTHRITYGGPPGTLVSQPRAGLAPATRHGFRGRINGASQNIVTCMAVCDLGNQRRGS